ncbi:helix-turn-helix domain-containing protein [Achromobacter denitrificans]
MSIFHARSLWIDGLPQPKVLTTIAPPLDDRNGRSLPDPVRAAIVGNKASALRAWRNYCGISLQTLASRTKMCPATLSAIDSGDVAICEWTVSALAKGLHIKAWQLLEAQTAALERGSKHLELYAWKRFRDIVPGE